MVRQRISRTFTAGALALTILAAMAACGSGSSDSGDKAAPAAGLPFGPNGGPAASEPVGGSPPEVDAADQPLSTFALDVDTASYGYARRQLADGRRPDRASIRPEEFVNAFRQGYRQPAGNGFAISTDGTRLPDSQESGDSQESDSREGDSPAADGSLRLMRVGLQTRGENPASRPDAALTFVVDVSGSMAETGKLDLVQAALRTLVDQLRPTDRVAIVTYSDHARVVRPMTPVRERAALLQAVDALRVAGSTNLEAGLVKGYEQARDGFRQGATNRVILLSDGLPNVGNTDADPILKQVAEAAGKQISLLGVGVGSDYGDAFMERLADNGDGYVVYVSELNQARRVFVEQLPAALSVRALDAKAQVQFDPEYVSTYRLIGYENRALSASAFRDDRVDGGEVGPGHAVTALYAVRVRANRAPSGGVVATVRVRWQDPVTRQADESSSTITLGALQGSFDSASPRLRVCYVAAYFAEVLRQSAYSRDVRLNDLALIADGAASASEDREVTELAAMIRAAGRMDR